MQFINKQKFFNRYLPMFLSVVLIVAATFVYLTFRPQTPVAEAAPALVQGNSNGASNASSISVVLSGVTAGHVFAAAVEVESTAVTLNSVTATCVTGNFTLLDNPTTYSTVSFAAMAYGVASASGSCTVTAMLSGSTTGGGIVDMIVHELSGVDAGSPIDGHQIQTQNIVDTNPDSITSGTITTTKNGDYIFGFTANASGNGSWAPTVGSGYVVRKTEANVQISEDKTQSTASSVAATFTSNLGFGHTNTGIMAFKPATLPNISIHGGGGTGRVKVRAGGGGTGGVVMRGGPSLSGSSTFGYQTIGATADSNSGISYFKAQSVPASNGTLVSVTFVNVMSAGNPGHHHMGVGLYTDNGGSPSKPSTLIASVTTAGGVLNDSSEGYATTTSNLSASITAGTQYWFGISDGNDFTQVLAYKYDTSKSNSFYYLGGETSFPGTAGVGSSFSGAPYIYATYTISP